MIEADKRAKKHIRAKCVLHGRQLISLTAKGTLALLSYSPTVYMVK